MPGISTGVISFAMNPAEFKAEINAPWNKVFGQKLKEKRYKNQEITIWLLNDFNSYLSKYESTINVYLQPWQTRKELL